MEKRWGREWRKRVKMLAQLCTPTYEMWSEVFPTGPEETLSRLRSLVGRNWSENHKTFPRPSYYFFFFFPRITNRKESGRRIGTYTDRKNRERVIFISFSLFVLCTKRRDRLTNITYWQISLYRRVSCVHLSFFYFLFFIFFFSFHRFRFAGNWMFSDHQTT